MTPKKILLLDDSALVLEMTSRVLEEAGFSTMLARDLEEFERHRATAEPDLILLDVQMPEAFGDDVGTVVRHVRGEKVPILLVSSLPDEELAKRVADAELDGFVSKRAGVEAIVAAAKRLLGVEDGVA